MHEAASCSAGSPGMIIMTILVGLSSFSDLNRVVRIVAVVCQDLPRHCVIVTLLRIIAADLVRCHHAVLPGSKPQSPGQPIMGTYTLYTVSLRNVFAMRASKELDANVALRFIVDKVSGAEITGAMPLSCVSTRTVALLLSLPQMQSFFFQITDSR